MMKKKSFFIIAQNKKKGFTLLELLIVVFLLIVLSSVILTRGFSSNVKMRSASSALLDTAKEVRQRSLSVKQFYTSGIFPNYGIEFDRGNPTRVRIYADCLADDNNDAAFDQNDRFTYQGSTQYPGFGNSCPGSTALIRGGFIENRPLLQGVRITALRLYNSQGALLPITFSRAYVEFFRPEPTTWITVITASGAQQVIPVGRLDIEITDASGRIKKTISMSTTGRIVLR